jgi:hypothetical protein
MCGFDMPHQDRSREFGQKEIREFRVMSLRNGVFMMSSRTKRYFLNGVIVTALAGSHVAWAEAVSYKISGFGTLGATKTDTDDTGFRASIGQLKGASKDIDLGVDSRAAVQGSVFLPHDFAVTAQILGIRRDNVDFDMGFEWLYAQYTGVPGLDVKVGRVVLPAFLVSDSRRVGYASPWLRVPPLVYSMMPMSNVDGGQATYRHAIGSAVLSAQWTYGGTRTNSYLTQSLSLGGPTLYVPATTEGDVSHVIGLNATLEWGDWTARISQVRAQDDLTSSLSVPGFGTVNTPLSFKDKFQEVGVQYDNGSLVVMSEFVRRKTDPALQHAKAWYVGAGYHFGAVMPYAIVSQFEITKAISSTIDPKTKGTALGLRYDFATNVALKGEWARYRNYDNYIFTDSVSPAVKGKNVDVMSIALDFVF